MKLKPTEPTPNPSPAALYFARRFLETRQHEFKLDGPRDCHEKIIRFVMDERCEVVEMKGLWLRVSAEEDIIVVEDITPGSILHRSREKPEGPVGPLRAMAETGEEGER